MLQPSPNFKLLVCLCDFKCEMTPSRPLERLGTIPDEFGLLTIHNPAERQRTQAQSTSEDGTKPYALLKKSGTASLWLHVYFSVCLTCVCLYVLHVYVCMYVCMYVCTYVCVWHDFEGKALACRQSLPRLKTFRKVLRLSKVLRQSEDSLRTFGSWEPGETRKS